MSSDDEAPDLVPLQPNGQANTAPSGSSPPISAAGATGKRFEKSVPVTLITGYLGSGKTTLVERILTLHHGYKIAVILNEIGDEKGIEKALLQDEQGVHNNVTV